MRPINVLSLFDGMSCGRIALERAGIPVANYFASEIDKHAIKVSKANWPDIKHLGDVRDIRTADLPQIDLLIGGSPCQGFSYAGKLLNFDDPRSALFFEFVNIKNELTGVNPELMFMLENVRMRESYRKIITEYIGVNPVFICSSNFSAQKRKRYYWLNIPGLTEMKETKEGPVLYDILDPGPHRASMYLNSAQLERARHKNSAHTGKSGAKMGPMKFPVPLTEKAKCLTTVTIKGSREVTHIEEDPLMGIRIPSVTEVERLRTVPEGYTSMVAEGHRRKMLGNGWTVDVIAHIFKNLKTKYNEN